MPLWVVGGRDLRKAERGTDMRRSAGRFHSEVREFFTIAEVYVTIEGEVPPLKTHKAGFKASSSPICGQSDTVGTARTTKADRSGAAPGADSTRAAPSPSDVGRQYQSHSLIMRTFMRILMGLLLAMAFQYSVLRRPNPEQVAAQLLESTRTSHFQKAWKQSIQLKSQSLMRTVRVVWGMRNVQAGKGTRCALLLLARTVRKQLDRCRMRSLGAIHGRG